jgi:isoleucyl-tRNA synthetase
VQRGEEDETEVSSEDEEIAFKTMNSKEEVLKTVRNTSRFLISNIQDNKIIAKGLIKEELHQI